MANAIEILINAKDNASGTLEKTSGSVMGLTKATFAAVASFAALDLSARTLIQTTVGFAKGLADEVEQLGRLEYVTGLSSEQLQVFRRGLERNGLSVDQLGLALRYFQNQLAGSSDALVEVGITADDTFGALLQLRSALASARTDAERTELASKALGMRNVELARAITEVAGNYDAEYNTALSRGSLVLGDQAIKLGALDDALDDFVDTTRAFKIEAADAFGPILKGAVDFLNALNDIKQAQREITEDRGANAWWAARGMMDPSQMVSAHGGLGGRGLVSAHGADAAALAASMAAGARLPGVAEAIVSGYNYGTEGASLTARGGGPGMKDLAAQLFKVEEASQKLDSTFRMTENTLRSIESYTLQFGYSLQASWQGTLTQFMLGVGNIGQALRNVIMDLFAAIAEAIATYLSKQAAGWLLTGIGTLVGGPAGGAIGKVGGAIRGNAVSGGGNTFVIQSIDSKTALDSLVAPTGGLRRANDRIYDVAMAGAA